MSRPSITRRRFVSSAVAVAAAPLFVPATARGANDRIAVGFIGTGRMGQGHVNGFRGYGDVHIAAVCDVDRMSREQAAERVRDAYGERANDLGLYRDYRELLGREDIDAVIISTPDHWHARPILDAARAGKHIYCEKPLTLTVEEARQVVRTVRQHDVIFQTGSQQRSEGRFRHACELVRNGYIGEVKTVHVGVGGPSRPCDLPAEMPPEGLDWDLWVGPAPYRPFHPVLRPPHNDSFPNWRAYWEFSGGGMTDWGAHHFDIAQWGLGADESGPVEVFSPHDSDFSTATFRYADDVLVHHGGTDGVNPNGVLFTGAEGTIEVNRGHLTTSPASLRDLPLKPADTRLYRSNNHHRDWLDSIRAHRRPICDVEIGARSVVVCHLGNIAYWQRRSFQWDPEHMQLAASDEAVARMLHRAHREPWTL